MSFTNSTPNLHLPQWTANDKPQFATDINNAFSVIDSAVTNIKTQQDTTDSQFEQIKTDFEQMETDFAQIQQGVQNANTNALAAKNIANNAFTNAENIKDWMESTSTTFPQNIIKDNPSSPSANYMHAHYNPQLKLLTLDWSITAAQYEDFQKITQYVPITNPYGLTSYFYLISRLPIKATMIKPCFFEKELIEQRKRTIETIDIRFMQGTSGGFAVGPDGYIWICGSSSANTGFGVFTYTEEIYILNSTFCLAGHFDDIQLMDWNQVQ